MSSDRLLLVAAATAGTLLAACSTGETPVDVAAITETTGVRSAEVVDTLPPVETTTASDETAVDATTPVMVEPALMPEPDFQLFLRTRWEYDVGRGPGLIESELGYAPVVLEPGTYTTDAMYTPVTFTLDQSMRLVAERPTFMVLVDERAAGLWDVPLVHLIRPRALVDPAHTSDGPPDWPPPVDGWDIDAWFTAHPGIEVARSYLDIGGLEAARYDISFPADTEAGWQCGPDTRCIPFVLGYGGPHDLVTTDQSRLWVIPQGDDAPIVLHAVIGEDDDWGAFGELVDSMIASTELGDPVPAGIPDDLWEAGLDAQVPAGTVELPILDGVRFELADDHFVRQSRNWSYITVPGEWDFYEPNVEIAAALQAFDFTPIDNAVQLADLLVAEAGATRKDDQELLGQPAVVVEMSGVDPGIPVFRHVALPDDAHPDVGMWYTQDYVELWAVDTPSGVLILTAEAANPDELVRALELHEQIRATLELT